MLTGGGSASLVGSDDAESSSMVQSDISSLSKFRIALGSLITLFRVTSDSGLGGKREIQAKLARLEKCGRTESKIFREEVAEE